jgi:hypothetical protein
MGIEYRRIFFGHAIEALRASVCDFLHDNLPCERSS